MDTGYDFLQPEFLNILFFQQKSLVIFPYVDIKHLKALEIFTEGYTVIDLDSTALHNVSSIISHEAQHSYSLKPTFYFIVNAPTSIVKDIMELPEIHCIINTPENVESLAKDNEFIFYNKKSKHFLNLTPSSQDLNFATSLMEEYSSEQLLLQKLRDIHTTTTQIYSVANNDFSEKSIIPLLEKYDSSTWGEILLRVRRYYDIQLPDIPIPSSLNPKPKKKKLLKDFSEEYQLIVKHNRKLGQEFIQALHNYREQKVNPAHLELDQLFYPEKLYSYLRNHHWEKGIPQDFIDEWVLMKNTGYNLTENEVLDFQILFQELDIPFQSIPNHQEQVKTEPKHENHLRFISTIKSKGSSKLEEKNSDATSNSIPFTYVVPSINNFLEFKRWVLAKIASLEDKILN